MAAKELVKTPEIDFSLESWIFNTREILHQPLSMFLIICLLMGGTFAEVAPRSSLIILDNVVGSALIFSLPFIITYLVDWPTGLLAAVVALIIFTRLDIPDTKEGFVNESEYVNGITTKLVSNSHRWFVEKILGERPIAIADDRVVTKAVSDEDNRSNSSSSMSGSGSSDSSSTK